MRYGLINSGVNANNLREIQSPTIGIFHKHTNTNLKILIFILLKFQT